MISRLAAGKDARDQCAQCHRVFRVGQSLLEQKINNVAISANARVIKWHTSCVAAVVDSAPAALVPTGKDERAYANLREKLRRDIGAGSFVV